MSVHDTDKYDKIKKALGIPLDEPIFILRAQDKYAPIAIRHYRNAARALHPDGHTQQRDNPSEAFKAWDGEVTECSQEFLNWQEANPDKVKEPD